MSTAPRGTTSKDRTPILWMDAEPARLPRDHGDIAAFASQLNYFGPESPSGLVFPHGGWSGELPRWPFDRAEPPALTDLIGGRGVTVVMAYPAAYPMVPPIIYPLDPEPTLLEQTQTAWHVAPGGSLCLLQTVGAWQPDASVTELLAKAAGWRIEYALMKAGAITAMSINGIVSDSSYDHLIDRTVRAQQDTSSQSQDPDVPQ
ncbi:ubiquitin-conjugating enzyme family protein [Mycolicibacterium austroafricanum]|uniref:hypothetical protein n=1 Tax=Mycolicibacterium austroafricanum TaxID=39687 RepID=UPI0005666044|nr:hypothetical protein [Mycolicibacterium austroafricanum]QZY47023.1 hypothetical protein K5L12_04500 [Mycolicibacterium austroafricanum]